MVLVLLNMLLFMVSEMAGPDKPPSISQLELQLVQSKSDIENPTICVQAKPLWPQWPLGNNLGMAVEKFIYSEPFNWLTYACTKLLPY